MNTTIRKIGNSEGVILPKELLERMNLPRTGFEAMSFVEARGAKHKFDFADVGKRRIF